MKKREVKNRVSKSKIAAGYTLLLAVLLFSLFFVRREMESLVLSDNRDVQWTDSVLALIREKDANVLGMLRMLSEANADMVPADEIERIIARQDSAVTRQRVQHRVITHRDTVVARPRKKGFFRRLGEVFVPPKEDTAVRVKTSLEFVTDTVIEPYNPADSLHEKLLAAARQKREEANAVAARRKRNMQRLDYMLTARIDSLLKEYETETLSREREEAVHRQAVRHRSARIIGGIAVGAVLLSALFLVIIGRDITRSNRYRRELEEARRRAEDLLAIREKLMLAITHDFKAPLGSIMGYADLLSRLTVDERQRFYLDNMKTSSEHLLKLVVDLLDFHRLDLNKAEVNRTTFHPSRLLEEIHVSFEPLTAAKGLAFHCDIAPELDGTYICDPLRLRQIINNLLSNAVKFTDQGSIAMTARYEARRLVVAIADTGRGMEPADRERIFQEFTRLPGAQGKEGFGLGLSIVRMLVQLLEGTIEVDSVPGKGSTFTIYIPIYPVRNEERRVKNGESETGNEGRRFGNEEGRVKNGESETGNEGRRFGNEEGRVKNGESGIGNEERIFGNEERRVKNGESGIGNEERIFGNEERRLKNEESGIGNEERRFGNEEGRVKNGEWGIGNEERIFGNEERRVKNEESGIGNEELLDGLGVQSDFSFPVPHSSLKNVLLIDDDRIQLTLTAAMLRQSGINSVSCLQPDELSDALRTETFDVLLTDVQMPAMNGFDLLKLLRASNIPQAKTIPVIAVTARSDMKREEFTACGFAGCLHKPFTVQELLGEMNIGDAEVPVCEMNIGDAEEPVCEMNTGDAEAPVAESDVSGSSPEYNFSALTAFAGDDPEAAKAILESFVSETRLNAARLRKAADARDMDGLAAVSHKMIPVFTLLGATEPVALLKELEASRGRPFSEEANAKVQAVLSCCHRIIHAL